jgi:hypothetical protein
MSVFILVELIEAYRLFKRITHYGLKSGILIYDVSQWSRIFTFVMFYTFTPLLKSNLLFISLIQKAVILFGAWFIFILFPIELLLCSSFLFQTYKKPKRFKARLFSKGLLFLKYVL